MDQVDRVARESHGIAKHIRDGRSTAKMPATINMSQFCFNRSTGIRLVLYRCATMRAEPCTRNEGATARAAKAGAVYRHRGLRRMHLSPSGTVALRSRRAERRIINRSGRRHASPGGLAYPQDKKLTTPQTTTSAANKMIATGFRANVPSSSCAIESNEFLVIPLL